MNDPQNNLDLSHYIHNTLGHHDYNLKQYVAAHNNQSPRRNSTHA
jgi:hypothetical protein